MRANYGIEMVSSDLISRAKLFDISAANQNQGGKNVFSARTLGPQKGVFYRRQFVIWPSVLIIIKD